MKLYFSPLACSLASRITVYEGGLDVDFVRVEHGRLPDGSSVKAISPMGYVPALALDDGSALTENPAVLHYLADQAPEGVLAPPARSRAHYAMLSWLGFINSELHKAVFKPLLSHETGEVERALAHDRAAKPLDVVARHLEGRTTLLGEDFSIADAYLTAVLNWCEAVGVDLKQWPSLFAYRERMYARPAVARALGEEVPLFEAA